MSEKETVNWVHPTQYSNGMTLRDYFAGQALAGTGHMNYNTIQEMAKICYDIADAMMEARK